MGVDDIRAALARLASSFVVFLGLLCLVAPVAHAQDEGEDADTSGQTDEAAPDRRITDEVTVTGSRVKRDTFTSISPLQVISGQISREVGLIDPGQILQESTAATGVQTDLTFGGFRLDNGPAASTVDLRGLGASRTLFLVNGRRLAPSGVEGVPSSPDTNLIPGSLVQQYEVLLDGASSVYGSDAVAGVVNVILRKDFDGLELEGFTSIPSAGNSNGIANQISVTWGRNFDRGFYGFGAEYTDQESVSVGDREWFGDCERHAEITTAGEIRTRDQFYNNVFNMEPFGDCKFTVATNFMTELGAPALGSLLYSPGFSNTGIPNFSDYSTWSVPVRTLGGETTDVSFRDYNQNNGSDLYSQIVPDIQTTAALAYGEYTFEGEANLTAFFEVQYNRRKSDQVGFPTNLGVVVPALNPFNPCNPGGVNGVDCGLAYNSLLADPNYEQDFFNFYGAFPADFGLFQPASGPIPVQPVVTVRNDRDTTFTDLDQYRYVVGLKGDMPFMNFGPVENWSFDLFLSDTESDGDSSRLGVREDRLELAVGAYSSTGTPCDNDFGVELEADTAPGCVPVDMFAPSLYADVVNNQFATQAETDYLMDSRDFRTKYRQTVGGVYATGEVFSLPGGPAQLVVGIEYREDEIKSIPDNVAAEGLFPNFFVDQGAVGEKWTREFFAELELPILANVKGAKELTVNQSTRYTEDEFYGGAWTYSSKLAYRPLDSLLLRGTVGTSYRAPNLRENFLLGQTGFLQISDPCVVSEDAFDVNGDYDPTRDQRAPEVIANCQADPNVDPFSFTNGGTSLYFTEVSEGGAVDLDEENSKSFSGGLVWEQPFFTSFDLVIGATYYEIEVTDEIIDPSAVFIIGDCYGDLEGDSAFCDRISRNSPGALLDPSQISFVDEAFINRDRLKARGVDLNMTVEVPTQMFNRAVDITADFAFNRTLEISSRILDEGVVDDTDTFEGEFGFPEWQGIMSLRADVGDFRFTWSTRYLSSVEQDIDGVDPFDNVFIGGVADTCLGPQNGDVDCRDIGYADNYFTHAASIYYFGDTWTIGGGVRNVTNTTPPFIDGSEVTSINNRPIGRGYDVFGRTAFVNVEYNWQ